MDSREWHDLWLIATENKRMSLIVSTFDDFSFSFKTLKIQTTSVTYVHLHVDVQNNQKKVIVFFICLPLVLFLFAIEKTFSPELFRAFCDNA